VLRSYGYEASVALSAKVAMWFYDSDLPEVIVADIIMPEMDGIELARAIRGREGTKRTVLIALTGLRDEHSKQRTKKAGFDFHLVKPLEPILLDFLLRSLLFRQPE
jgi:CheY-like chemotaxis protein